jgi:hypothetical protein
MNPKNFNDDNRIERWEDALKLYDSFAQSGRQWIFRGLPDAGYELETTLERARERFAKDWKDLRVMEKRMIRQFKRQAHLYLENPPKDDDTIEWLALMQHFGAPTRLLDWTYSFFVALFFAVEKAEKEKECAVGAIDMKWVIDTVESLKEDDFKILRDEDPNLKSGYFFDLIFDKRPPIPLVYSLNPERLNERLIVQQGLFLAPADISKPFEDNLDAICKNDPDAKNHIRKIIRCRRGLKARNT